MSSNYLAPPPPNSSANGGSSLTATGRPTSSAGSTRPSSGASASATRRSAKPCSPASACCRRRPSRGAARLDGERALGDRGDAIFVQDRRSRQRQWCIIPAQCLYVPLLRRRPQAPERWRIRRVDRSPLSIAGLWDRWVGDRAARSISFAMLTINCDLHPLLTRFHRPPTTRARPPRSARPCCSPRKTSTRGSTPRPAARRSTSARSARTTSTPSRRRRRPAATTALTPLDTTTRSSDGGGRTPRTRAHPGSHSPWPRRRRHAPAEPPDTLPCDRLSSGRIAHRPSSGPGSRIQSAAAPRATRAWLKARMLAPP